MAKAASAKASLPSTLSSISKTASIAHAAFDSDDENSTLKRFHPEVGFIDPNHPVEIDRMVEALKDADVVVVDCRAASTRIFLKYFEDTDLWPPSLKAWARA
jgi:hypothetical protein